MDAVLAGGTIFDPVRGRVQAMDLVVTGNRIGGDPRGLHRVDVSGCVVTPGFVCAHHHLYSALARGMPGPAPAPRTFPEILERVWWRLDRALDHDTIEVSALLGAVEAAKAGTTTIVDHHASPEVISDSLDYLAGGIEAAGVRAAVCYEVTDRHGPERGRAGVTENARFIKDNTRPLIRGMVGAHASFTIGPDTMEALVATARDSGAPIHIHVAEDDCDERDSLEKYGMRTVHRLAKEGALAEGDLIAHGVHVDAGEIETARASGPWIAHNPRSNMNNGVGYAPVLELGEKVALGTDGIDGDMFAEARACYLKAREASWETGPSFALERLVQGASLAASVFGLEALGTLEPGAPADVVVLDYDSPTAFTGENAAGHLTFGMTSALVQDVMVAGEWIVRDGNHVTVDEQELRARSRAAAGRLWRRMEEF